MRSDECAIMSHDTNSVSRGTAWQSVAHRVYWAPAEAVAFYPQPIASRTGVSLLFKGKWIPFMPWPTKRAAPLSLDMTDAERIAPILRSHTMLRPV